MEIYEMILFDPDTMAFKPVSYGETKEKEKRRAEFLNKNVNIFTRNIYPGKSNEKSGYGGDTLYFQYIVD